jgi:uncharacterized protein (DUF362 family)
MNRRQFLLWSAAPLLYARPGQKPQNNKDEVIASATRDATPRVGIVLSSFKGGADHDGTKIPGLAEPLGEKSDLTSGQVEAMVRKAIELGSKGSGDFSAIAGPDDWIVIKTCVTRGYGLTGDWDRRVPAGARADLYVVRALLSFLIERHIGARITIAEAPPDWKDSPQSEPEWITAPDPRCGGMSYRSLVDGFSKLNPNVQIEVVDLNTQSSVEGPVQGGVAARRNAAGVYAIAKIVQECDKLISVSPLRTDPDFGAALSLANYTGIATAHRYGMERSKLRDLGTLHEVAVDLFSYRPADYVLLGGRFGLEGEGAQAAAVAHNVVVGCPNAVSADAVGAALMGFEPAKLEYLELAGKKGFGTCILDEIWVRGNQVEEARREFRKPARFARTASGSQL